MSKENNATDNSYKPSESPQLFHCHTRIIYCSENVQVINSRGVKSLDSRYSWVLQHNFKYLHQMSVSLEKVSNVVSYGRWCKFLTNFHTTSDVFSVKSSNSANDRSNTWLSGWSSTIYRCLSFLDLYKQIRITFWCAIDPVILPFYMCFSYDS